MPVRIRLQRHGKKGNPFFWIVAADGRAKRDGRYLEKIGTYNPNTNPAKVELDVDKAVKWLENGAQPSDTARTLLSYRGAMIKHHLNGGVKKGAFSQEEADKRLAAWLEEKQAKIQAKIDGLNNTKANDLAQRLEAEKAVNQKRIDDLTAAPEAEKAEKGNTAEAVAETATVAVIEEADATEIATETVQEETAADEAHAQEAPAVEKTKVEEAPAEAAKTDEAPAAEETKSADASAEEEETKE
tara:strand:- start:1358 stop:2086 length:729 start_codon:yes stop_codon:yes gene_type:complete